MPFFASDHRKGLALGLGAYAIWGVLPLYFKALTGVPATEIVAHRIIWSLGFLAVLATVWHRWPGIRTALTNPRVAGVLALTAVLIAANWLIYIYAVLTGHVLEGSLGYYLNPLVNVLLGTLLLKEKLSRAQLFATLLAAGGVLVLAVGAGSGLWISLVLAASFASYGFIRKVAPVDAVEGLAIETMILTPLAVGWVILMQVDGTSAFRTISTGTDILLVLGGAVTAIPLLLFTAAARRLPYSTLGFLQYIAPSLQFLLAVLVFGERLTTAHIVCFAAIWTALAIFTLDGTWGAHRRRKAEGLA